MEGLEFLAEMDVITDDVYRGALVIVTDTAMLHELVMRVFL